MGTPILERDLALAQLDALAKAAGQGAGHTVFVTGEAGAGKTTLLRAFEDQMTDARALRGACEDLSIPEPLGPLRDLALDAGVDLDTLWRTEGDRLSVFLNLLACIERSEETPILLIEDLHWADEATLDFVRFAARRLRTRRILMVVTARDDETEGRPQLRRAMGGVAPKDATRIVLEPLSAEAVSHLAAGSGQPADEVYRITGGNPFYVTELLQGGGDDALRSVQDTVLNRLGRLPPDTRNVLEAVSIFPRRAERDYALAVAEEREEAFDPAIDSGLIQDDGTYVTYRHEIARLAVETALRPTRRRRLNKVLLEYMQADGRVPNARQMHHARAAGDSAQISRLAPMAGREAMAAGANLQAADYLSIAVERADPGDATTFAELLFDAGEACRLVSRIQDAMGYFERALSIRGPDNALRGRILQRLSRVKWAAGQKVQARTLGNEAIDLQEGPDTEELAMALASRAQIAMSDYEMEASLPVAQRALDMARRLGRTDIVSHALSTQSLATLFDSSQMNALYAESIEAAKAARSPINLVRCIANGGVVNWYGLRFADALEFFDEAIATGYETDTIEQSAFYQGFRVHTLDRLGRWDEAFAMAREIIAQPLEQSSPAIMLRLTASRISMRRGESDGSEHLAMIDALMGEEDGRHICDVACFHAERAWLKLEDQDRAQAAMEDALALKISPMLKEEVLDWQRRIDAARLPDEVPDLHEVYRESLSGNWTAAAERWQQLGDPYREALALAEGDAAAVTRALSILDRLKANRVRETVLVRARERGLDIDAPARPRATTRANPAGLTQRQMQVLALLGDGMSNAEIADKLFVSSKTVDHHVSAILGKLDVASRGEAAALARKQGWF
ncbi:ATP-binding protein [Yoonia sediminilitoris]|uniref:Regulatory LuxR family protein n=1 Tax=Yoonia sediminilitoris TaxID=1286148 RepID=A0A2T6KBV6_9RHOB|nr:LuxR family transcriptional regulator [Yoonia sediminilitoris]PUB12389.1 regulatory LuxR family protein [Yoonia sediminilitoris]RCW93083.1 regulatory LuxR family protein [Yoonia sediminilitoris]